MKRNYSIVLFFTLLACSINAQQLHYSIDQAHSQIKFVGLLGNMMEVEGKFGDFWGDVFFDAQNPDYVSVTIVIDPASLDSENEWRDKHLQNEEFLDVEAHDAIIFKSTKIVKVNEALTGNLFLKGKERSISVSYKKEFGPDDDPWQNRRVTFSGSFTFSRQEFGLGPTEGFWGKGIADKAEIFFTVSATRQNMERMSIFKNEQVAAIWDNLANEKTDQAFAALDSLVAEATEERKERQAQIIDFMAKRLRQFGHEQEYLMVLEKNATYFPETDWVQSNLGLGYLEIGKKEKAKKAAEKALELNPKNSLALELLKYN